MMHLPLDAMDQIGRQDPMIVRRVVQILMMNLDVLVEAFYQLHNSYEDRRIAAALQRITPTENTPVPLSQTELGSMSNASRKQVNAALKRFADAGWLTRGYRSIVIRDIESLRRFSAGEEE
jgi:CRP-like cAMP-binding protein